MFNKNKFKAVLIEKGITIKEVAKSLRIAPTTLYRKINGESDFFCEELRIISNLIGKECMEEIFFA